MLGKKVIVWSLLPTITKDRDEWGELVDPKADLKICVGVEAKVSRIIRRRLALNIYRAVTDTIGDLEC